LGLGVVGHRINVGSKKMARDVGGGFNSQNIVGREPLAGLKPL